MPASNGLALPTNEKLVDKRTTTEEEVATEFLALLMATHYSAKKWEAERGKGSLHYAKVLGTLICQLQTEMHGK